MRRTAVVFGAALAVASVSACREASQTASAGTAEPSSGLDVVAVLGGPSEGFLRAERPREFSFPADHGPHDGFRTEWWYVTGNLAAVDDPGRKFGFQLTFFRNALSPPSGAAADPALVVDSPNSSNSTTSHWRADRVWMAHLAISDEAGGRFRFTERFAREALDLAGATTAGGTRVHLGDWRLEGAASFPERAVAWATGSDGTVGGIGGIGLDLGFTAEKAPVLQGEHGLSRKGAAEGNASYYYSVSRLATRGRLTLDGRDVDVAGLAWLDREWSTSSLEPSLAGWDWFALQLDDASEVMFYRLRGKDGSTSRFSAGSFVAPDGATTPLGAADVELVPETWFESSDGARRYPSRWRFRAPELGLDLLLTPRVVDQELRVSVRYWEGAVHIEGSRAGAAIRGAGFVEMTGYSPP
jgi:predicted secreted hydrolase